MLISHRPVELELEGVWFTYCCLNYWGLAQHMARLPEHHWVQRILRWCSAGTYRIGRPNFHFKHFAGTEPQGHGPMLLCIAIFENMNATFLSNFAVHSVA